MVSLVEIRIERLCKSSKGAKHIQLGFYFLEREDATRFYELMKKATGYIGDKIIAIPPQEVNINPLELLTV